MKERNRDRERKEKQRKRERHREKEGLGKERGLEKIKGGRVIVREKERVVSDGHGDREEYGEQKRNS